MRSNHSIKKPSSSLLTSAREARLGAVLSTTLIWILVAIGVNLTPPVFAQTAAFGTPGIELKPFTMNHRQGTHSVINLSFLLDAPAGKDGFIRVKGGHLVKPDGKTIRFWGFNLTEWSRGSVEIPPKEDAPVWADTLARFGVNYVRLHFLDLAAPRGMIDATRDDTQHFDPAQLDKEDFFISELLKRGIYVDLNLNVGRGTKAGDNVLVVQNRIEKGPLLFDKRLIELEKDYAHQLLTHVNPYTKKAYVDEPGVAIVEIVNEDAIYVGWTSEGRLRSGTDRLIQRMAAKKSRSWSGWPSFVNWPASPTTNPSHASKAPQCAMRPRKGITLNVIFSPTWSLDFSGR